MADRWSVNLESAVRTAAPQSETDKLTPMAGTADGDVYLFDADGYVQRKPAAELAKLTRGGWQPATTDEVARIKRTYDAQHEIPVLGPDNEVGAVARNLVGSYQKEGFQPISDRDLIDFLDARETHRAQSEAQARADAANAAMLNDARARQAQQDALQAQYGFHVLPGGPGPSLFSGQGAQNAVQTVGEGLTRGVALGLDAPQAYGQAGLEQLAETISPANPDVPKTFGESLAESKVGIAARKEANPGTAIGSEVTGALLPALATGGESLLARGAMATPTNLVARGAGLAAKKLVPEVKTLSGAFGRVLRSTVEGGLAGVPFGVSATLNDAFLRDDYSNIGEKLLLGAGKGMLVGGVAGLGISGTVEGGTKLFGASEAVPSPAPLPADRYRAVLARDVGDHESIGNKVLRRLVPANKETLNEMSDELINSVSDEFDNVFLPAASEIDGVAGLQAKKNFVMRQGNYPTPVSVENALETVGLSPEALERTLEDLNRKGLTKNGYDELWSAASEVEDATQSEVLSELPVPSEPAEGVPEEAAGTGLSAGEAFWKLDGIKRRLDAVLKVSQRAKNRDPDNQSYLYKILSPKVDELRSLLEDEELWGALGKAQREVNTQWAPAIRAKQDESLRRFFQRMGEQDEFNPHDLATQINKKMLSGHMRNALDVANDNERRALLRLMDYRVKDAWTRARIWGSDETVDTAIRMQDSATRIKDALDRSVRLAKKSPKDTSSLLSLSTGVGIGGAAKAVAENPLLGIAGAVGWVGRQAAGRMLTKRLYEQAIRGQQAVQKAGALRGLLDKPVQSLTPPISIEATERLLGAPPQKSDHDDISLNEAFGPQMSEAFNAAQDARIKFLMDKAGPRPVDALGQPAPYDPQTLEHVSKYVGAVFEPRDAIERLGDGSGTKEDLETVQTLYPASYQDFVRAALTTVQKKKPTYDQRIRISKSIGVPLDDSLQPQRFAQLQALATTNNTGTMPPSSARAPKIPS